jgi:hypothetical protein
MKKIIVEKLGFKIRECEKAFSNPKREFNKNNERFKCINICVLSESVALVTFEKNTGKHSNALFFFVKDYWVYFFPTDSHELGIFNYLNNKYRLHLENFNYNKNFKIEVIDLS